jgi:enolase-phosphatase E1
VTSLSGERGIRAILLDIEGTTTPMAFVHDVLFPYARVRLQPFISRYATTPEGRDWMATLLDERRAEPWVSQPPPAWDDPSADESRASATRYCEWLMDRDRKSPALKALQGLIWQQGYEAGDLMSQVFADVPVAFECWGKAGISIAIYSSGSVLAQQLLFGATTFGDLTRFIDHFFDTSVGPKTVPESYARIARLMGQEPGHVLFLSDAVAELDAARIAGLVVALACRPGNAAQAVTDGVPIVTTLEAV